MIIKFLGEIELIEVAVTGANGRMGSKIIKTILIQDDMKIVAAIEAPETPLEGRDIGELLGVGKLDVLVVGAEKLTEVLKEKKPDVLVDFTIANAAVNTIKTSAQCGVNVVVGTTGLTDIQIEELKKVIADSKMKAVIAPNMAVGVNVFFKVIRDLAKILYDYDIEIMEAHHKNKADAPSGTAIKAFEIIADELGRNKDESCVYGRKGLVGARTKEEIGIHAIRGGDIVGDHTVLFAGPGERLEIKHQAHSRAAFASGAVRAARWVVNAEPGVYSMANVLGS